jgi:hypothetical protein
MIIVDSTEKHFFRQVRIGSFSSHEIFFIERLASKPHIFFFFFFFLLYKVLKIFSFLSPPLM